MAFLTWLPEVLRNAGVRVLVLDGALSRSTTRSGLTVQGVVWHDTVTPNTWDDGQVLRLLRDGHSNLRGPLSQVGIDRAGTWHIVAMGKCNHNGYGTWGNDSLGLEFFNGGANRGERFTDAQVASGLKGTIAVLRHLGLNHRHVMGHKETDADRKIDPWSVDMSGIRARIATALTSDDQEDVMSADPRGAARLAMREFLGRSPSSYAELDFHAGQIRALSLNGYIEWLETQDEAVKWAAKIGAEVRAPDRN